VDSIYLWTAALLTVGYRWVYGLFKRHRSNSAITEGNSRRCGERGIAARIGHRLNDAA